MTGRNASVYREISPAPLPGGLPLKVIVLSPARVTAVRPGWICRRGAFRLAFSRPDPVSIYAQLASNRVQVATVLSADLCLPVCWNR
jgi:hypothetical protein